MKRNETQLVNACLDLLVMFGVFAWRNNTGATKIGDRFIRFGMKGASDILGVLPGGRFLAVECKMPKGKTSEAQDEFLAGVNASGGLGIVVRSVDELAEKIEIRESL